MRNAATVSHQKQLDRNATSVNETKRKRRKINETARYPAAHTGLVKESDLEVSMSGE
jgi:hypothetical protein